MNTEAPTLLKTVLEASWQGSLVIVLILLLRPVLGLRVPARWRYLLWTLVLLRLLVPAFVLPPSPASLQNLAIVDRPLETSGLIPDRPAISIQPSPVLPPSQGPAELEVPAGEALPPSPAPRSWWKIAAVVWLSGSALTALWIVGGMTRLYRRVHRDSAAVSEEIGTVWNVCCLRIFGVKSSARRPRLIVTGAVQSPALVGLFRPTLLIPADGCAQLSAEDWEHIFFHELAHLRQRDHWMQALQLIALCAHWFNPLVWFGFRFLRADRELAADEWTLRQLSDRRPAAYGDTLLKVLSARSSHAATPGLVGIMEDGAQMKQRLRHIVAFVPRRLLGSLAGLAVVVALAAVVLGQKLEPVDLSNYEGLTPAETLVAAARRGDEPVVKKMLGDGTDINGVIAGRGERTALTAAIAAHQLETVKLLVDKGADLNLKPEKADAPIVIALRKGDLDTAEYLQSKGATCDAEMLAAAKGDNAAIEVYLQGSQLEYDKVKLLGDIAAAHGHRAVFATIYDALKQLPGQRDYFPYSRGAFVVAITRGHREVVEEILSRDPNLVPGDGVNRLAAPATRTPGMREWLATKGIKVPDYTDGERLIDAAERDDAPEIRRLLKAGVDVNYRGESDWTPISKAATWGCPRAVKVLLENGAKANTSKHGYTTLSLAKTPEIADLLLAAGADVNGKLFGRDIHAITYPVAHGSKEMVQWFLDHGVDPQKVGGGFEPTLLFTAHSPEIVDLLVAHGVDPKTQDKEGRNAVTWQLEMQTDPAKVVEALLKHGADPNSRMKGGATPLMRCRDGASVDVLVAAGANLQAKDDNGNDVLVGGWGAGIPSRVEALRRHGVEIKTGQGASLLINAILLRRDVHAVQTLLALGVDPNSQDRWEGRATATPLGAAVGNGCFEIAKILRGAGANDVGLLSEAAAQGDLARMTALLDAGTNVDELSKDGATPLHYAVRQAQAEAVQLLLRRGANVNRFTVTGYTPQALARNMKGAVDYQKRSPLWRLKLEEARVAMETIMAALDERQPDANFRNEAGETALLCGAGIGSSGGMNKGVNVNAQRADGMTAVMLAIVSQPRNASRDGPGSVGTPDKDGNVQVWHSGRAGFVLSLIEAGADLSLRNKDGKTALDLANENGNEEMLEILAAKSGPPAPIPK